MKIICISDTHGLHRQIEKKFGFPEADMIIHAGDISSMGEPHEIEDFMDWYSSLYKIDYKIFIAGNHDWGFYRYPEKEYIKKEIPENIIYLEDSGVKIEDIKIWGSPQTPYFHGWAFNRKRGEDIKRYWDAIPDDVDILITHGPPHGIADYCKYLQMGETDHHVGCKDLLLALHRVNPFLHVFGHIHEHHGKYRVFNTNCINASSLDGRYYPVHEPILINY